MSALRPRQSAPAENPFYIYGAPTAEMALPPRAAEILYGEPARRSAPMPEATPSQRWRARKKRQEKRSRLLLKILGLALLAFVLLPLPFQKQLFTTLHLGQKPSFVEKVAAAVLPSPVRYAFISSPFGRRWGRMHQGIDFAAAYGEAIRASAGGTVIHSGWEMGYGKSVIIDHGHGLQTRYAHCSKLLVKKGQFVEQGEEIAEVGSTGHSTGPHLHFEVIVQGIRKNPALFYHFGQASGEESATAKVDDSLMMHSLSDLMKLWHTT